MAFPFSAAPAGDAPDPTPMRRSRLLRQKDRLRQGQSSSLIASRFSPSRASPNVLFEPPKPGNFNSTTGHRNGAMLAKSEHMDDVASSNHHAISIDPGVSPSWRLH